MGAESDTGNGYSRVTVVWRGGRLDVALPDAVAVADLLPEILGATGLAIGDGGARNGGWCLARIAQPELDTALSLSQLRIRHGDVLELRPRELPAPEIVFDDCAEAVGHALRASPEWTGRWNQAANRALGAVALVLAAAALLIVEASAIQVLRTCVVAVVVLLLGATALTRTYNDAPTALLLGAGATLIAPVAGARAVLSSSGAGGPPSTLAAVGVAGTTAAVVAGIVLAAIRIGTALYVGVITAGLLTSAVVIGAAVFAPLLPPPTVAAAVVVVAEMGLLFSSRIAFRLAGLPAADNLSPDDIRRSSERAGRLLTGLFAGSAASVAGGGVVLLISTDGLIAASFAVTASALLIARCRRLRQRRHVLALLIPAALALTTAAVVLGHRWLPTAGLWVPVGLLAAAAVGFRRMSLAAGDETGPNQHGSALARAVGALLTVVQLPLAVLVVGLPTLLST